MNEEINDIIECIIKFDDTETVEVKGRYFDVIQRDMRNAVKKCNKAAVSSSAFKVGDKVRTRGDIGGFKLVITKIHNDHYCTAKGYGKERHFNVSFLEHYC